MSVGGSGEPDSLLHREPDDLIRGIKFIHGLPPAGRRELEGQSPRGNKIEGFGNQIANRRPRSMSVDLDEIQMRQAIHQPSPGHFPNAAKIIDVNLVDVAPGKLFRTSRDAVEHLIGPVQVVNRTEDEIETFPILFHPLATRGRSLRIVIQLEPSADFYVRIS